jgi:hypothetical protein
MLETQKTFSPMWSSLLYLSDTIPLPLFLRNQELLCTSISYYNSRFLYNVGFKISLHFVLSIPTMDKDLILKVPFIGPYSTMVIDIRGGGLDILILERIGRKSFKGSYIFISSFNPNDPKTVFLEYFILSKEGEYVDFLGRGKSSFKELEDSIGCLLS